ncbi:LysR family transcriptional regulator [Shimia sediminis]|uniref:LysR family transcriptional regulator n=1 Tax=Shimia sediminis TaxID=2497945 RepID=UPI000F8EC053|nr:LysR family transcriptional regulator [Shimia sediminis]
MKIRQIQFAVTVAETESFSLAAERCNATQPTLSNAVSQLEKDLGGKLFSRTTRKVEITPFGRHMLPYLQAILSAESEALAAAAGFHNPEQKLLKIGFSPLVDMHMVASLTTPFSRQRDDVDLFFKECLLDDLADRIETGAIDLAILPADIVPDHLDRLPFYADPLFYLPQHGVSPSDASVVSLSDLPDDPVIMTGGGCGLNKSLEVLFAQEGKDLTPYPGYAMSYPVIEDWTWMGLGAGVLPKAKLSGGHVGAHRLVRSNGQAAEFQFLWVWRREARDVSHVHAFLEFIRQNGPRLVAGQVRLEAV